MTYIQLPGGHGSVSVNADGTGTVHDLAGRVVTTLPAHTVTLLLPAEPAAPSAPRTSWGRFVARLTRRGD